MSQEDLATKIGYKHKSAISKIERGERDISQSMIIKYATALNVSPTFLLFGEEEAVPSFGKPIKRKKLPKLGNVACGDPIYADEDITYVDADDVDADFCLTAQGDSMVNARIFDGDLLFVKKAEMVDDGQIAVVLIGDEATVKRVYYDRENNILTLVPENPVYKPMRYTGAQLDNIRIIGRVVMGQYAI
jgi:repressor LexA